MLLGVQLMQFGIAVMLSHFEEVARKHIQEQIQRGLPSGGIHLVLEDAGETPILWGIGVHLDFSGNTVRDVTDKFQQFRVRVFVAFVLGDKLS